MTADADQKHHDSIRFADRFDALAAAVGKVVVGQPLLVQEVLIALFARGHVLIEGVPGLGKTLLVRAIAAAADVQFRRIQFTPDLMPSDVTGGTIFDNKENQFRFVPGPVFTQLLLADEINRAPAKTQAALLEAMQERQVTVDGKGLALPRPFLCLATQNPIESQGTYALPEAQLDRFLFKVHVGHPALDDEKAILRLHLQGLDPADFGRLGLRAVVDAAELLELQAIADRVDVAEPVLDYAVRLVHATRAHRQVHLGASPRASIALIAAGRVQAAAQGRSFVVPDDLQDHAPAVLRHRLLLQPDADLEGATPDEVVREVVRQVPVPRTAA
ncbi:MAG: MoxR family ATPase [Deltaproteobacteria bacterium]|nr:MoxR family ATPase [Deltaproteobacteria bacterium]